MRGETERKTEGERIEALPELKSKSQAKFDVLATEGQILVKDNDKLRAVCQTAVDENSKKLRIKHISTRDKD
jgi:ABC-type metal ion transport system substrate-binding protein